MPKMPQNGYGARPKESELMTTGRPSKYRPEYCEMLIEHMAQGYSFPSFGAIVNCNQDTLYEWAKVHPEFSDAKKIGGIKERFWWETAHRNVTTTGEGNITGVVWAQKNKWPQDYKERPQEINQNVNLLHTHSIQQLVASLPPEQLLLVANAVATQLQALPAQNGDTIDEKKE